MVQQNEIDLSTIGGSHKSEATQMVSAEREGSGASSMNCFSATTKILEHQSTGYRTEAM